MHAHPNSFRSERNYRVVCIYQPRSCRYFESHRTNTLSKRLDLYLESNCDFNKILWTDIGMSCYMEYLYAARCDIMHIIFIVEKEKERGDVTSFEIIYYLSLSLSPFLAEI